MTEEEMIKKGLVMVTIRLNEVEVILEALARFNENFTLEKATLPHNREAIEKATNVACRLLTAREALWARRAELEKGNKK